MARAIKIEKKTARKINTGVEGSNMMNVCWRVNVGKS